MREKLAFNSFEDKERFIKLILENETTKRLFYYQPCNRVEIITRSSNIKQSSKEYYWKIKLFRFRFWYFI